MQNNATIGEKIKTFRKRAGLSQMDLEIAIGTSTGSISRIENNQVNPTKETILSIAKELILTSQEMASLFNIDLSESNRQLKVSSLITNEFGLDIFTKRVMDTIVYEILNQLDKRLDLIGSSLAKVDIKGNTIQLIYVSESRVPLLAKSLAILNKKSFRKLKLDDNNTLTKTASLENRIIIGNDLYEFIVPPLTKTEADFFSKVSQTKSMVAAPISRNGEVIGVFSFALKKYKEEVDSVELGIIHNTVDQISVVIDKIFS